jgi:hypothetical protein
LRIQGDKFSVENEVVVERGERLDDVVKAPVEHLLVARKQRGLFPTLHRNAAIAVEFDLKGPVFAGWQRRDQLALHRLNEGGFWKFAVSPRCPRDIADRKFG